MTIKVWPGGNVPGRTCPLMVTSLHHKDTGRSEPLGWTASPGPPLAVSLGITLPMTQEKDLEGDF